jgi:hypothetical protein
MRQHIRYATSLAMFTMTLPPQRSLTLSRTTTLHCPLLPLPVRLHRPFPYLHRSISTTASRPYRRLSTHIPLVRPSKAPAFPSPHQIKPPLVKCEAPSPWVSRLPSPLREHLHRPHLPSLPPYLLPFLSSKTQPPWRLPVHQTSHHRLLPI